MKPLVYARKKAFDILWRHQGRPYVQIVERVERWNLPEGYRYDKRLDSFVDENGKRTATLWEDWGSKIDSPYLPGTVRKQMSLVMPGVAEVVSDLTIVLPSMPEMRFWLGFCWGLVFPDLTVYRVKTINVYPFGTEAPEFFEVSMDKV